MKVIFRIFIFLIISPLLFSQTTIPVFSIGLKNATSSQLVWNDPIAVGFSSELEEINGGPYYKDEWLEGRVVLKSGQVLGRKWKFKYNTFQDELHIQLSSGDIKIPLKDQIQSFMLMKNGRQHFFVRSNKMHKIDVYSQENTFYEVLHNDGFMLLKNTSKHFAQSYTDSFYCSSCDTASIDFFFTAEKYFLVTETNYRKEKQFKKIKFKRKSVIRAIPQYKALILQFLKEQGQKLETEQDLLALLQYLEDNIGGKVKI